MSDDKHSSTGGFFSGLLFGAAAGAMGFFLLKTDDGKKAREVGRGVFTIEER